MKKLVLFLILILVILAYTNASFARPLKIFMVQSYSPTDLCGVPQLKGALDTLKKAGIDNSTAKIRIFFMETKTKNTTPSLVNKVAEEAYNEIKQFKPDIVFLFDDPAFSHLAPKLIGSNIKVIFSGLNIKPEQYNKTLHFIDKNRYPTANITGVYEKLHILPSIKFIEHIIGKHGTIGLLSSQDTIGKIVTNQIVDELKNTPYQAKLKIFWVNSIEGIKNAIENGINANDNMVAYIVNTHSISADNKTLDIFSLIPKETKIAKKPDIAINKTFCKRGLFGGVVLDFYAMGKQAAKMALKVINGIPISSIRVEDAQQTERVINLERARQLNIKIPLEVLDTLNEVY